MCDGAHVLLFLPEGSGHQWGLPGGLGSPHHYTRPQEPTRPATVSTT